ncbi:TadE/TadG family type IV pilus assembly protein [Isoptericola sp. NPDC056618]|uniref:TadE/TadG family type IV pilus assembly protein n=1 Tax=Isoptericola sp. NPDC056618 TaxID=3345878 RepID=UPI00367A80DC
MSPAKPARSPDRRAPRHAGPRQRRRTDERGSASVQLVVLLPALVAIVFLALQGALFVHGRSVAIAAAAEGARAAGTLHATTQIGQAAAADFVADVGGDALNDVAVSGQSTTTTATITVTGRSMSVIPGWRPVVSQSASVPVERLTAP